MMVRFILLSILLTLVFRSLNRLWVGIVRGMSDPYAATRGDGRSSVSRSVHMMRDPVCGTFVVPERALTLPAPGGEQLYFCSTDCRDKYRRDSEAARGRTA
jgi:YHS domain-containing protein